MARVTVEDCIVRIPNRFELVMTAAQRSRELSVGAELTVDRDNDKNPVVALREIAEETVDLPELEASLIRGLQKHVEVEEPVEEGDEFLAAEEALSDFAAMGLGGALGGSHAAAASAPVAKDLGGDEGDGPVIVGFKDIGEAEAKAETGEAEAKAETDEAEAKAETDEPEES